MRRTHPQCRMTLWPRGYMGSGDKLRTKYLILYKACDYHTWQDDDSWWEKLTHNLKWLSDHVIRWGYMTNWKLNISSSARSITTKHGRLVTYGKGSPPSLQSFSRAQVIMFCLWENARIILGYWLPKNWANFSRVRENFCAFRFSTLATSISKILFPIVKKSRNILLLLVFQTTIHHL